MGTTYQTSLFSFLKDALGIHKVQQPNIAVYVPNYISKQEYISLRESNLLTLITSVTVHRLSYPLQKKKKHYCAIHFNKLEFYNPVASDVPIPSTYPILNPSTQNTRPF